MINLCIHAFMQMLKWLQLHLYSSSIVYVNMFVGSFGIIQCLISASCSILNNNLYNIIIVILHKQQNNTEHCAALRLIGLLAFPTCRHK